MMCNASRRGEAGAQTGLSLLEKMCVFVSNWKHAAIITATMCVLGTCLPLHFSFAHAILCRLEAHLVCHHPKSATSHCQSLYFLSLIRSLRESQVCLLPVGHRWQTCSPCIWGCQRYGLLLCSYVTEALHLGSSVLLPHFGALSVEPWNACIRSQDIKETLWVTSQSSRGRVSLDILHTFAFSSLPSQTCNIYWRAIQCWLSLSLSFPATGRGCCCKENSWRLLLAAVWDVWWPALPRRLKWRDRARENELLACSRAFLLPFFDLRPFYGCLSSQEDWFHHTQMCQVAVKRCVVECAFLLRWDAPAD